MMKYERMTRQEKRSLRRQKCLDDFRRRQKKIEYYAKDIMDSSNFNSQKQYLQHGDMSVNKHSMNVARYSLSICEKLRINCNQRELIRGALLHDYFLYDWHKKDLVKPHKWHGFRHPGTALRNAESEYNLTPIERDIISKHMWPLTLNPPRCREAWIVTSADKWCSLLETFHVHKGHGIARPLKEK